MRSPFRRHGGELLVHEALALRYRPTQFTEVVGNRLNGIVLHNMVARDQVPHALLFSGPSGVGKTTSARILAQQLGATDVIEVDAASTGGVDAIRSLLDLVQYSTGGGYRILLLDEAQSITKQGFEALLKTLEEPPAHTVFVLVTTEPHKIPETILSRLVEFVFLPVSENDITERLQHITVAEGITVDLDLLRFLAQRANGNVRTAVQSLDLAIRADALVLATYLELTGEYDVVPFLVGALTTGRHEKVYEVLDRQLAVASPAKVTADVIACIIDVLVIKSGGTPRLSSTALERRTRIAQRVERESLLFACKILWDAQTALRSSEDPRGTLELSLALIAGAFGRSAEPTTPQTSAPVDVPTRKLTLAEMQGAARKDEHGTH